MSNSSSKYFRLKLWQRETGALWLPFEHERIKEFSNVKPNEQVTLSGYVKWVNSAVFALVPTPFSNQTFLSCINYSQSCPAENEYITVTGLAKLANYRPLTAHSRRFNGDLVIEVYNWANDKPAMELPQLPFDYKNFRQGLTSRIEGLEPQIRDFIAFSAISSPAFLESVGGLNMTIYDSTKSNLPQKVVRELKAVIPQDMGSVERVETPYGRFQLRYKYAFVSEDADKPLSPQTAALLSHKSSKLLSPDAELSMSLYSKNSQPTSIEDPPCSLSDIPTVLPEDTSVNRLRPVIDQFDALKFMMVNHMKIPIINDLGNSQEQIVDGLEKLVDSYGLDPTHLSKYGFLNASYNAKPQSVLRQSLAYARANDIQVAGPDITSKVFREFFEWNFKYVYEIWEDLLATKITSQKRLASLNIKYRDIIRIIRKYHSSREPGAKKVYILKEAKTPPHETEKLLKECLNEGIIYEPLFEVYRLTRELA
ncbi:MAG: hypothetical protein ACQCN5_02060 [Candidatus Bathyarchaeia archaeon]|jgi:hypothetical protein